VEESPTTAWEVRQTGQGNEVVNVREKHRAEEKKLKMKRGSWWHTN